MKESYEIHHFRNDGEDYLCQYAGTLEEGLLKLEEYKKKHPDRRDYIKLVRVSYEIIDTTYSKKNLNNERIITV